MDNYRAYIRDFLKSALHEDIGTGDITTELTIPADHQSEAVLMSKDDFILAGIDFAEEVFSTISNTVIMKKNYLDGETIERGEAIAALQGPTRALLMGERLALNILQRLSGIATLTGRFVEGVKGTDARIIDTRKTTPNMRYLEKYAVTVGGGHNHRFGLYDGILIKDNHIKASGGIKKAVEKVKAGAHHLMNIEVEVQDLHELKEAIESGVRVIMLDNMSPDDIKAAVSMAEKETPAPMLESSGGVNIDNIRDIAMTGVNYISIGALTHSARSVDISMKIT